MSELIKVSGCDNPRRMGDVVFVHGPDGDARSTWRPAGHRGPAWPEWLGEDLSDLGVWLLDYEGRSPGGNGHGMPLADRATHALALLETEGLGERPLVFIGHSLGGLLVKQLLRHGREYGDPSWRRITDQTRGIVFLSTPHSGTDITSWVEHLGSATAGTASNRELQENDPRLRELNVWFRNQFQSLGLRVQVYCEKVPHGGRVVVDDASADPGLEGVVPIPLDEDHLTISRIRSRESMLYKRVALFSRDCLSDAPGSPSKGRRPGTADAAGGPGRRGAGTRDLRPRNVPFQVPPLPDSFVPRPEVSHGLKRLLLSGRSTVASLVISAVQGLGGVGKSTLAVALARDPEVLAQYPDGVLWVTLGQKPDLLPLLAGWVQALGDYDFNPLTIEATSAHLRTLLSDRAALLVVDDAWDPSHVLPFLVGSPSCRVLITTREAAIAKAVRAVHYDLDIMTPEQAMALLSRLVNRELGEGEWEEASKVAKAVGYLPLAIELAAAQISDGVAPRELLSDLDAEVAQLESLSIVTDRSEDECTEKRLSLLGSFILSLRRLPEHRRREFAWLGVLPEDVTLTAPLCSTLWSCDERTAAAGLRFLRDKSLLMLDRGRSDGSQTYRLHDLMHDMSRHLLVAPSEPERADDLRGLGMPLHEAHAALLGRYRAKAQGGLWHTLPDDGYVYNRLIWHLEQAGQTDEVHKLLAEENPAGHNGWYEARERLGQIAGYLTDLARAWNLVTGGRGKGHSRRAMGLQARYALINASIKSSAGILPLDLLVELVESGVWSQSQGFAFARQIPGAGRRANALTRLIAFSPAEDRSQVIGETLAAIAEIDEDYNRAEALSALASHLEASHLDRAVALARSIANVRWKSEVLAELVARLHQPQLVELRRRARAIGDGGRRAATLAAVAPHLSPPRQRDQAVREAVAAIPGILSPRIRAEVLVTLAAYLPLSPERDDALREVLRMAVEEGEGAFQAQILTMMAPLLEGPLSEEVLAVARPIADEWWRAVALAALAARLAASGRSAEALALANGGGYWRGQVIVKVAPYLEGPLLDEALELAQSISDRDLRVKARAALAPRLAASGRPGEALDLVRAIDERRVRAGALVALVPHLAGRPEQDRIRREALSAVLEIPDVSKRLTALGELAPHLGAPLLEEALAAARSIGDNDRREEALAALAPRLAAACDPGEALALISGIDSDHRRSRSLWEVGATLVSSERVLGAMEAAESMRDAEQRAEAIAALAPWLALRGRPGDALARVSELDADRLRAKALAGIARYLDGAMLGAAVALARSIGDLPDKSKALGALSLRLGDVGRPAEAFTVGTEIKDASEKIRILGLLAPSLTVDRLREALALALALWPDGNPWGGPAEGESIKALTTLARSMAAHGRQDEALKAAWSIPNRVVRTEVLGVLAPWLASTGGPAEILARGEDEDRKAEILAAVAGHLDATRVNEALELARSIVDADQRSRALASIVPPLAASGRPAEALVIAGEITDKQRCRALSAMAPHLDGPLLDEAMELARSIAHSRYWHSSGLEGLALRLAESGRIAAALEIVRSSLDFDPDRFWEMLKTISPQLDGKTFLEAVVAAHAIYTAAGRSQVARLLTDRVDVRILDEALELARSISDADERSGAMAAIAAPLAASGRPAEALSIVRSLLDADTARARALSAMAPFLDGPLLDEAAGLVRTIGDGQERSWLAAVLAPWLVKWGRIAKALAAASSVVEHDSKSEINKQITHYIMNNKYRGRLAIWDEILENLFLYDREDVLSIIIILVPMLDAIGGAEATREAGRAVLDVGRWWP